MSHNTSYKSRIIAIGDKLVTKLNNSISGVYTTVSDDISIPPFKKVIISVKQRDDKTYRFYIHVNLGMKVSPLVYRSGKTSCIYELVNDIILFESDFIFSFLKCMYIPVAIAPVIEDQLQHEFITEECSVCYENTLLRTNCNHPLCGICHIQIKSLKCPLCRTFVYNIDIKRR